MKSLTCPKIRWFPAAGFLAAVMGILVTSTQPAAGAFQENLWGARPAGMAGAFTALADDANAPAYNPAGIALIPDSEVTFMYAQLFTGVNLYAGEESSKLGLGYFSWVPDIQDRRYGSFALSWSHFSATSLYREDSFVLSYADSLLFQDVPREPILAYGINLKFLRHSFTTDARTEQDPVFAGGTDANGITVDLGFLYKPNFAVLPGLQFGLAGQNLNEPDVGLASTDRVPRRIALGAAYKDPSMPLVGPSLEYSKRGDRTMMTGAWEAWIVPDTFAMRVGGNQDQIGGGMGYQFSLFGKVGMRLDYSLLWPFNVDGTNGSHRVSISSRF